MRITSHLVRCGACAAALALLATGAASVPALAAGTSPVTLAPKDGAVGDLFGESTATSSNGAVTAVGSPEHNSAGAVYVFTKTGAKFSQTAELAPGDPKADEQFGQTVAISGNGQTLVAAAPGAAGTSGSDQGAAYVFSDASGTWTQTAKLTVPGTAELGTSLAISASGSTIVAGSPTSNNDHGVAFVFTKSGGTFTQASEVLPPKNKTKAAFAAGSNTGMSASGSLIAFGAPTATAGTAFESGEVFVATKTSTGTWKLTGTDAEPHPVSDDDLGGGDQSVAVAGNGSAVIAGARAANGQTGQAIIFPVS